MEIRDMRRRIGLSQGEFAKKYHIPLQTLKQWESSPKSTSYRKPPEYVPYMLKRLIESDYDVRFGPLSRAENLIAGAMHSRGFMHQWLRYLRKEFADHKPSFTDEQIDTVLSSEKLSMVQKVIFKEAIKDDSFTNGYLKSRSKRFSSPMADVLMKGITQ